MRAVIIPTSGAPYITNLAEPLHRSAGELLGGMIEHVNPRSLKLPYCMLVNEDYLRLRLPFNPVASFLYGTHVNGHPICGPAIIMKQTFDDVTGLERKEAMKIQVIMEAMQHSIRQAGIFGDMKEG